MKKAVLFGLWGTLVNPHPLQSFHKFESRVNLPRDSISEILASVGCENVLNRCEQGKVTLSQMFTELKSECQKKAEGPALPAPTDCSIVPDKCQVEFNGKVLDIVATLKNHGIATCVLANIWVDDTPQRASTVRILSVLETHFDVVIKSCHAGTRLPEPTMYHTALNQLDIKPHQAICVDVKEENIEAAKSLGISAVKISDISDAITEIEKFTGIKITVEQKPLCCNPDDVCHGYVTIKPGVKTHFVEMGEGPPVLLCHGFPESWFSWRYQIPALANAGFRAIAVDLKGFGDSSAPEEIKEYSQEIITQDLVTFLDKMGLTQVTVVGHDWGGTVAWNMALCYPERLRAVASLNTPLFPVDPTKNPLERLKSIPIFEYQIYFQEPGVAESELMMDLERTFKIMFYASDEEETHPQVSFSGIMKKGGLFVGLPEEVPRSAMVSEAALEYYVQQYKKTGFRGPLNLYRNVERNWRWLCSRPRGKILMPALMVTAEKDPVLQPSFTTGMEKMIPNLTRGHLENCGHWTQMERPCKLNEILIPWLKETHQKASVAFSPKL